MDIEDSTLTMAGDLRLFRHEHEGLDKSSALAVYQDALLQRANDLIANRWSFFQFDRTELDSAIDWNYEYALGHAAPMTFAPGIDYRDVAVTGDAKVVWEPNRHQHLVVLARAYGATGIRRYAETVIEHIESWIEQCPYGRGMNWRSPLELAIRLINWVWALGLIAPSNVVTGDQVRRLLPVVYRHLWEIRRKYSQYSSANNHLIGEAAGVYIGSTFFRSIKGAERWRDEAVEILAHEIRRQTLSDGGNCELAVAYHLFVLEFFLLAGIMARRSGRDFDATYWRKLESMFDYLAALQAGGDHLPMLGDADDGYVLDLEAPETRARSLLSVGGALFGREDFRSLGTGHRERLYWLLGEEPPHPVDEARDTQSRRRLQSCALASSGYYLLQAGHHAGDDRVSLLFDCGSLGFGSIAAHGHADALSFTLRAFGADVIVDPGTYDYFTWQTWRDYFRSTRAHNTIVVDGLDQSEMRGPFLWGSRATARCTDWRPTPTGGVVSGEHDGYRRLDDPVIHRRTINLEADRAAIVIRDELQAKDRHQAEFILHFSEECRVSRVGSHVISVEFGRGQLTVDLDQRLQFRLAHAESEPAAGWVSRGYHRKSPSTSLLAVCDWSGRIELRTGMTLTRARTDARSVNAQDSGLLHTARWEEQEKRWRCQMSK